MFPYRIKKYMLDPELQAQIDGLLTPTQKFDFTQFFFKPSDKVAYTMLDPGLKSMFDNMKNTLDKYDLSKARYNTDKIELSDLSVAVLNKINLGSGSGSGSSLDLTYLTNELDFLKNSKIPDLEGTLTTANNTAKNAQSRVAALESNTVTADTLANYRLSSVKIGLSDFKQEVEDKFNSLRSSTVKIGLNDLNDDLTAAITTGSNKNTDYALTTINSNIDQIKMSLLGGDPALALFATGTGLPVGELMLRVGHFVSNSTEQTIAQTEGLATINKMWNGPFSRFSHLSSSEPAVAGEVNAITIDSTNKKISNTAVTSSFVGTLFANKVDYFTIDAQVKADTTALNKNGAFAIILASLFDGTKYHTLSAVRTNGIGTDQDGNPITLALYYNYKKDDEQLLVSNSIELPVDSNNGWKGGCNIVAYRRGDIFIVQTCPFGQTTANNKGEIIFDLNSDIQMELFKGASQFGFGIFGQDKLTVSNMSIALAETAVFRIDQMKVFNVTGATYTYAEPYDKDFLMERYGIARGRFFYNKNTQRFYFCDGNAVIHTITQPTPVNGYKLTKTINAGANWVINVSAINSQIQPEDLCIQVLVKDSVPTSRTLNKYINSEGVATVAFSTTTNEITIYNDADTDLEFKVILQTAKFTSI